VLELLKPKAKAKSMAPCKIPILSVEDFVAANRRPPLLSDEKVAALNQEQLKLYNKVRISFFSLSFLFSFLS
jgi:hypothetical protein